MIRTSISKARAAKNMTVVVRKPYTVLIAFAHKHVMEDVGTTLMLSDAEAKYHLMAHRIAPEAVTVPAAPVSDVVDSHGDND